MTILPRPAALAAILLLAAAPAFAQGSAWPTTPGGSVTDPAGALGGIPPGPAPNPPPPIAGPIGGSQFPRFASSIQGRWSASTTCQLSATQLVLTNNAMELRNRSGRLYYANVALQQQGSDASVLVTAAPQTNRMGAAGGLLGDSYVFRVDSANRIVPVAIQRANARRDRVGSDWPAFYRCR
jgi:hypothetical protein